MGTNCAPLVANLFLFCYESDLMLSLSEEKQSEVIEAFSSTSRYLDDLLNIDNNYFDRLSSQIYQLQLNKANSSKTEAAFLDLQLLILDGFITCKISDKSDDFHFEFVNVPHLDWDVSRRAPYGVYISQVIQFTSVSGHVTYFNTRNKLLTVKLLNQGYRQHKLRIALSFFF